MTTMRTKNGYEDWMCQCNHCGAIFDFADDDIREELESNSMGEVSTIISTRCSVCGKRVISNESGCKYTWDEMSHWVRLKHFD